MKKSANALIKDAKAIENKLRADVLDSYDIIVIERVYKGELVNIEDQQEFFKMMLSMIKGGHSIELASTCLGEPNSNRYHDIRNKSTENKALASIAENYLMSLVDRQNLKRLEEGDDRFVMLNLQRKWQKEDKVIDKGNQLEVDKERVKLLKNYGL